MKTKFTVIIGLVLLGVLIVSVLVSSSATRPLLGPLQVSSSGYTNLPDNRRVAVFVITNTNASSVAFIVFGPQARHEDGTWPNFAPVFRRGRIEPAGATAQIQVPPPNNSGDWRINVGYGRTLTTWERYGQRVRGLQAKLRLPELLKPPPEEELNPPVVVEVARER